MSKKRQIKFIYILPSLFTAASIFLAILSIVAASKGEIEKAAWFIVLGTIFDALDGRIARMTNTTSQFGAELDSLADVISFGMAPAFLLYYTYAQDFGKFGIIVIALYVIFGAVRLARFNVTETSNPGIFIGIPIPAAALFVITWILLFEKYPFLKGYELFLMISTLLVAFVMVSNIRYPSFKKINMDRGHFVRGLIILIIFLSILFVYPTEFLCSLITFYFFYGLGRFVYMVMIKKWLVRKRYQAMKRSRDD